jgi:hypothetical protein
MNSMATENTSLQDLAARLTEEIEAACHTKGIPARKLAAHLDLSTSQIYKRFAREIPFTNREIDLAREFLRTYAA